MLFTGLVSCLARVLLGACCLGLLLMFGLGLVGCGYDGLIVAWGAVWFGLFGCLVV